MTVKFQSQATGDLVMLQKHAHAVLKRIGKSDEGAGILEVKDMPAALAVFKALPQESERPAKPDASSGVDEDGGPLDALPEPAFSDEPVSLRKRAWPLVMMIERAMAEGKPVVWNVTI